MAYTATDFRKNLFMLLERVAHGETVEVIYKGAVIQLSAQGGARSWGGRDVSMRCCWIPHRSCVATTR
jgi:antitoxin (DNA-binding transcriptional repressor) of toxin-antitoxin stability system